MSGFEPIEGVFEHDKPTKYFLKIAGLISRLYPKARKIIEVGVGKSPYTILQLKSFLRKAEIMAVDINPEVIREINRMGIKAVYDDVFEPNKKIYEGADLIYFIRPPSELIPKLAELGRKVGTDVLIIPLSEDEYFSDLSGWERLEEDGIIAYLLRGSSPRIGSGL